MTLIRKETLAIMKAVNSTLQMPSVRKGSLRYHADEGLSKRDLMNMAGHTRQKTFERYLGYGLQLTKEDVIAQANVEKIRLKQKMWEREHQISDN